MGWSATAPLIKQVLSYQAYTAEKNHIENCNCRFLNTTEIKTKDSILETDFENFKNKDISIRTNVT